MLARGAVALIGVWILTGALFKLLLGTPADLPGVFRELPLSLDLVYKLAIAVELIVAVAALLGPRLGWILAGGTLLVFDVVLSMQIAAGETSCGCFGAKLKVEPSTMLAIDTALLVLLALTRPWSAFRSLPRARARASLGFAGLCVVLAALPWLLDRRAAPAPRGASASTAVDPVVQRGPSPVAAGTSDASAQGAPEAAPLLPQYDILEPKSWVGKAIWDTNLANWVDVNVLPLDATWIVYRYTCDHCRLHLERLSAEYDGVSPLALVRLAEKNDTDENRSVRILPTGPNVVHATAPDTVQYVVTTPVELVLEAGVVKSAHEGTEVTGEDEGH